MRRGRPFEVDWGACSAAVGPGQCRSGGVRYDGRPDGGLSHVGLAGLHTRPGRCERGCSSHGRTTTLAGQPLGPRSTSSDRTGVSIAAEAVVRTAWVGALSRERNAASCRLLATRRRGSTTRGARPCGHAAAVAGPPEWRARTSHCGAQAARGGSRTPGACGVAERVYAMEAGMVPLVVDRRRGDVRRGQDSRIAVVMGDEWSTRLWMRSSVCFS